MYIVKNEITVELTITDELTQYECKNIHQVKNIINELTKTNSQNSDWRDICTLVKTGAADSVDYICFINGIDQDCSVNIGYDISCKSYFVWVEI